MRSQLPIPDYFDPDKTDKIWKIPFQKRAKEAEKWAHKHHIKPAAEDEYKICLLVIDVQNTFCIPDSELFVAGPSGNGAVEDNKRLSKFIYRNLSIISQICPTMDTHQAIQIFHSAFWVDQSGKHPDPYTLITVEDVESGRWRFNPPAAPTLGIDERFAQKHIKHYVKTLKEGGKYDLTIWPYHVMLGSIDHALVSSIEEAIFFHSIARYSQPDFQVKGNHPLTEHYSVLGPEVTEGPDGEPIAERNQEFIQKLLKFDMIIIAGQAKSHCVAWTIDDLLRDIYMRDEKLTQKVYLLEDCTSPVVVPDLMDYTEEANQAFDRFSEAGMHVVRSTDPIDRWPDSGL